MENMLQFTCFIDASVQVLDEMKQAHNEKELKGKIAYGRCIVNARGANWDDVAPLEETRRGG